MPLTPADVHNVEFAKATIGKRGYHQEEVDALLDEATYEMIRLREENDALHHRLDKDGRRLDKDRQGLDEDRRAMSPAPPEGDQIARLSAELDRAHQARSIAEQNARQVRQQLDAALRRDPVPEPPRSDSVLAVARRTADGYLHQAQRTSRELIAEARHRSERVLGEAQRLVTEIEQGAEQRDSHAATASASERAGLRHDIAELTRFAEQYHAALEGGLYRQEHLIAGTATGS